MDKFKNLKYKIFIKFIIIFDFPLFYFQCGIKD